MPPGASLEGVPCLVRGRPQTFVAQFRRLVRDRPVVAFLQIEAHVDTKADLHRGKVTSVFVGSDPLATFNPATRAWFEATFQSPTRAQEPADILITTPESLYLILTSLARDALRAVESVIVDEIHAVVPSKRGSHLALTLERLEELRGHGTPPLRRVGLSATQRPLDEIARFLGGLDDGVPRPVRVLDAGRKKTLELRVEVPVEDMARLGEPAEIPTGPVTAVQRSSIWPAIHPQILELIRSHRSTLIFVNSRRLAERLAGALNELAGEELVHAHHGSIAREQRLRIEDDLKSGRLPALVATSSLELGIDMGAIDLVIQVESPPSVASGMQRIGRAGHRRDHPEIPR